MIYFIKELSFFEKYIGNIVDTRILLILDFKQLKETLIKILPKRRDISFNKFLTTKRSNSEGNFCYSGRERLFTN